MMYFHVLAILEHVFRVAIQPVDVDVLREHERVGATMQPYLLQPQAVHPPECLVGIGNLDVLQLHIFHLAEEFRAINTAVAHHKIVGVPDSGT